MRFFAAQNDIGETFPNIRPIRPYNVSETPDKINCFCRAQENKVTWRYLPEKAPAGASYLTLPVPMRLFSSK